jgi:hypothetical protein
LIKALVKQSVSMVFAKVVLGVAFIRLVFYNVALVAELLGNCKK